ncbi:hypothetical protein [Humisphaera borealis]|uniref:Uncharacterized protein n=1 Tax=Humisphaera borealis TaxID=2807512 RepID=A0A7M2WU10_9BACT|nr:hypothetical protein [Humisphaera borealis]QOV88998.1 hypothetical protein IPV69_22665 [Humisphaera borealis]
MSKSRIPTGEESLNATDRGEMFALTRALSLTRLAYRSIRSRSRTSPSRVALPTIVAEASSPALTPWDLIDETDTQGGVAFTFFQQRSEPQPSQSAA